ncbi:60 kDa lysophospholipase [Myotis brandtii]|uniref:60 kDa lysophospholipase n=1 Tax=Myotis brandtii TaxID=109478 RepID=S7ME63_MYOBR|nr:60 kDa lysophospholipase [Myotis brandtii]
MWAAEGLGQRLRGGGLSSAADPEGGSGLAPSPKDGPSGIRPASPDQRILYTVLECQPLFDSSDMTITEWVQIAQTIELFRGTRVTKVDARKFAAFCSPNLPPLAVVGADVVSKRSDRKGCHGP